MTLFNKGKDWHLCTLAMIPILASLLFVFCLVIVFDMAAQGRLQVLASVFSSISYRAWSGDFSNRLPQPQDPKCLSRTQQYFYRPIHRNLPVSAAFGEAWEQYSELHKSCTVGKNMTAHFFGALQNECKYLIYLESPSGLGNRLLSLATAFTYALLTNRVLLIDRRKGLGNLLCEPFPYSSWLLPHDFPYEEIKGRSVSLAEMSLENKLDSRMVSLSLNHDRSKGDERFFCEETQHFLADVGWLSWRSNQYYVTELFMMPRFWGRLTTLFPNVTEVFREVGRRLLLPANDIWGIVMRNYWSYVACAKKKVGVQIRLHGHEDVAGFESEAKRKIMQCLVNNGVLPEVGDNGRLPDVSKEGGADIAVVVASLQGEYARAMRKSYTEGGTMDGSLVRIHAASELGQQRNTVQEIRLALAEMWLLSLTDEIATSAYSTFGYVAQALGGMRPFILNVRQGSSGSACSIGQSPEPCTHYPVRISCTRVDSRLGEWIQAHVRPCQDQLGGWQLVHNLSYSFSP